MARMAKKRPQSTTARVHLITHEPPSNSYKVDYLLCVGQTPNIALSISVSPAATQTIEKKKHLLLTL